MALAPGADSVGNGELGSDREDSDLLTDAYAELSPHSPLALADRTPVAARPEGTRPSHRARHAGRPRRHCRDRGLHRRGGRPTGERRQLGPGPRQRLPGPEHPRVRRRLLRLRHPELRLAQPDDQHSGRGLPRRRQLDTLERSGRPASCRVVGQARGHLGTERRPGQPRQRLRHVLHGDGNPIGRPVHRHRHIDPPHGPLHGHPIPTRGLPERNGLQRSNGRQRTGSRRQHRSRRLHGFVDGRLVSHLEERRQSLEPASEHHFVVPAARTGLPAHRQRAPTQLLSDDQAWQSGIVEGPDMVETQKPNGNNPPIDSYYLFYSGSDEGASTYAIGWASCAGPSGPCTDESNPWPLLTTSPGLSGPGGPDVYSRRQPADHGIGRLAGLDDRLSVLRHPSHVPGRPELRAQRQQPGRSVADAGGARRVPRCQPELSRPAQARSGILAGRLRRRHLQLRRRAVLRLHRLHAPQQAGGRHGGDARRQRLLARGQRRRGLRLRRRAVLRLDREHHTQQTDHRPDAHARRRRVLVDRQ